MMQKLTLALSLLLSASLFVACKPKQEVANPDAHASRQGVSTDVNTATFDCLGKDSTWQINGEHGEQCAVERTAFITKSLVDGLPPQILLKDKQKVTPVVLDRVRTDRKGTRYVSGVYTIDKGTGGGEFDYGRILLMPDNITLIQSVDKSNEPMFFAPFINNAHADLNGGGNHFTHLGLFSINLGTSFISHLDSRFLGDNITDIKVNTANNGLAVSFLADGDDQSFSGTPNKRIKLPLSINQTSRTFIKPQQDTKNQNTKKIVLTPTPECLNMDAASFKAFSSLKSSFKQRPFITDKFCPLGYNASGKIAFISIFDTGPSGIIHIETIIQDLITDKVVWKDVFRTGEGAATMDMDADFSNFWRDHQALIYENMQSNGITPSKDFHFNTGDIHHKSDILTYTINNDIAMSTSMWKMKMVRQSAVFLLSKNKGKKRIAKFKHDDPSYILGAAPIGYIALGDDSKRVGIIFSQVKRGWEGPPHTIEYSVIGANLDTGFK
ncbi:MAG: hypothetical protein V3U57_07445 [Robiginitomaculum sp.]